MLLMSELLSRLVGGEHLDASLVSYPHPPVLCSEVLPHPLLFYSTSLMPKPTYAPGDACDNAETTAKPVLSERARCVKAFHLSMCAWGQQLDQHIEHYGGCVGERDEWSWSRADIEPQASKHIHHLLTQTLVVFCHIRACNGIAAKSSPNLTSDQSRISWSVFK